MYIIFGILLGLCWPRLVRAPVPCGPDILVEVDLGGGTRTVGVSATIEHGDFEMRDCALVSFRYEGEIYLGCDEGSLNVSTDGCGPRRCSVSTFVTVSLGLITIGVTPREPILSGEKQTRLCRDVNPIYRSTFTLSCDHGQLSYDASACVPLWFQMEEPQWAPRSRHAAVTLQDGAILLLGGQGASGALQEVWQWYPRSEESFGLWVRARTPPWTGRASIAAVPQVTGDGEQVVLLGGYDGDDRSDVWRWLRDSAPVAIDLQDSEARGTQKNDCIISTDAHLVCNASSGALGRRWHFEDDLPMSSEVHLELRRSGAAAALVAVQLDECRLVFQVIGRQWAAAGCTGSWMAPAGYVPGTRANNTLAEWETIRIVIDRQRMEVDLNVNDELITSVSTFAMPGASCSTGSEASNACGAQVDDMQIYSAEVVAWPQAVLETRSMSLRAPAGHWQLLVATAPWAKRSNHVVVGLPDGDLLLFGGVSEGTLLRDVWRWTPRRCSNLGLRARMAAQFELECGAECVDSLPHGQWRQLPNAPWTERQGHASVFTPDGVLMTGGRTLEGYKSDVWRWRYPVGESEPCSLEWQGAWAELQSNAPFSPRYGHRMVFFDPELLLGQGGGTTLLFGGYGGDAEPDGVIREVQDRPIQYHADIWCGTRGLANFSVWTELSPSAPFPSRTEMALVVAPSIADFTMLMFGGYDVNFQERRDFWWWTGENATVECVAEAT